MASITAELVAETVTLIRSRSAHLVNGDCAGEAGEVELTDRLCLHVALHNREQARPDQDLAAGRAGAEPRGQVRHRADHAVVVAPFETDPAERRVSRLDPDSETELRSPL